MVHSLSLSWIGVQGTRKSFRGRKGEVCGGGASYYGKRSICARSSCRRAGRLWSFVFILRLPVWTLIKWRETATLDFHPVGVNHRGLWIDKTLFQRLMESIRYVQRLVKEHTGTGFYSFLVVLSRNCNPHLHHDLSVQSQGNRGQYPISDHATSLTIVFSTHNYYGLNPSQFVFFSQGSLPCVDDSGHIIMREKHKIALSPDGSGGVFPALDKDHFVFQWKQQGIEFVQIFGIDNAMEIVAASHRIHSIACRPFVPGILEAASAWHVREMCEEMLSWRKALCNFAVRRTTFACNLHGDAVPTNMQAGWKWWGVWGWYKRKVKWFFVMGLCSTPCFIWIFC